MSFEPTAEGPEVGVAFVSILPSMRGFSGNLERQLGAAGIGPDVVDGRQRGSR